MVISKNVLDINIARISDFIDRHIASVPLLDGGVPPFSSIEFSNNALCNRRCIFCPRADEEKFPNVNEHISFNLFEKIIEELAAIDYRGRISFSGFCEPLLTKDLEKYIAFGKRACPGITIEMVSNGDALTIKRLNDLFEAGLDNIRVSLYDGPLQDKKFLEMKEGLKLNDKQFILRRRYLSSEQNYGLTISNRAGAITIKDDKIKISPLREPLKQPCYFPFYKMLIDHNGDVVMCSNDWFKKLVIGNASEHTVYEIWNCKKFNNARKRLMHSDRSFTPCNVCDVNGLYNGKVHFDAWLLYYDQRKSDNF